ncbi:Probable multidrug resistance-associated protein lethal(2)03659 [Eumeta japonica]|uniref:Probable multidrug resistance-associated protein lethal(2)03659 n=1 Tax=Eumeta variegata TaxID=151549 RepID=A0A4C1XJE1_EUMVA|nr:Probable multidrug resistance-associated protein lethal(2)03659 [Eumeta japonica]
MACAYAQIREPVRRQRSHRDNARFSTAYLSSRQGVLRGKIASRTDDRVKVMSELVGGVQVIKMYAWEKPFEKLVDKLRSPLHMIASALGHPSSQSDIIHVHNKRNEQTYELIFPNMRSHIYVHETITTHRPSKTVHPSTRLKLDTVVSLNYRVPMAVFPLHHQIRSMV